MGVEYYDKKYPDLAQASKEYEGFIDYLNSLGYIINDIYSPSQIPVEELEKAGKMDIVPEECIESGFVLGESHSVEFIKDGKSLTPKAEAIFSMVSNLGFSVPASYLLIVGSAILHNSPNFFWVSPFSFLIRLILSLISIFTYLSEVV